MTNSGSGLKFIGYGLAARYGAREYRYTVVNGRTVLVEPRTRRIVEIVEYNNHGPSFETALFVSRQIRAAGQTAHVLRPCE